MTNQTHTPTPWKYRETILFTEGFLKGIEYTGETNVLKEIGKEYRSCTSNEKYIVKNIIELFTSGFDNHKANAEHIVRCVNSHDGLVKLIKEYLSLLESDYTGMNNRDLSNGRIKKIKQALSKAGVK